MTEPTVDAFLEHFGVKGMRWGVRNDVRPSGSAKVAGTSVTRDEVKDAGLAIAKKTARYGAPPLVAAGAALASPIALPSVVVLGLSARVLMDPDAQAAIGAAAEYTKRLIRPKDGIIEENWASFKNRAKYGNEIVDSVQKASPELPADKDGPMFNPDAKLDTSRIQDANDPIAIPQDDKWKLPW